MEFGEGGGGELKVQCQSLVEPRQVFRRAAEARLGKLQQKQGREEHT